MAKTRIIYQPTDIVLAKVKGFPAWPAMIVPEEIIPTNVLKGRPGRPTMDEVEDVNDPENFIVYSEALRFRKNFKPHASYCIKFFCDDSYIWLKPVDFKPLTPEQCSNWLQNSKKQTKKLIPAYEMAQKGSQGIDVWEFIEYGSKGKPDQEEYVQAPVEEPQEEELEDDILDEPLLSSVSESDYEEGDSIRKGSRASKRQAKAKARESRPKTRKRGVSYDEENEEGSFEELMTDEPKATSRSKKKKPSLKIKIEIKKYKFEDDGDWSIVGLGPQEHSLSTVNSLVNKLSQKKNLELHNEIKMDLRDKLSFVNKLISDLIFKATESEDAEEYHMLVDELEQCAALRGSQDELVTVFLSDHELVINMIALFNLKQDFLRQIGLYEKLQLWFSSIFGYQFVPDPVKWSLDKIDDTFPPSKEESQTASNVQMPAVNA
ncbi:LANO_0E13740g1_1 [Lachancea nothofagi CBS 11611]|uniref:LANO_0E13740g1_1 n=1 Tax=Lachancea nothofagi CBS 11611 TaxID=1266666 RepID=A0A1G4JZA5_9SACH|nr:LANO_0E13740g1_1 [Lachancea nothofagi CBS 11611]